MGKKRKEKVQNKEGYWAKHKERKELKLIEKENRCVYELTLKLMKEDNLTYEQVQECYK